MSASLRYLISPRVWTRRERARFTILYMLWNSSSIIEQINKCYLVARVCIYTNLVTDIKKVDQYESGAMIKWRQVDSKQIKTVNYKVKCRTRPNKVVKFSRRD